MNLIFGFILSITLGFIFRVLIYEFNLVITFKFILLFYFWNLF